MLDDLYRQLVLKITNGVGDRQIGGEDVYLGAIFLSCVFPVSKEELDEKFTKGSGNCPYIPFGLIDKAVAKWCREHDIFLWMSPAHYMFLNEDDQILFRLHWC